MNDDQHARPDAGDLLRFGAECPRNQESAIRALQHIRRVLPRFADLSNRGHADLKGGKSPEIPVRHDVEQILRSYVEAAAITEGPVFRTGFCRTGRLTAKAMSGIDICRKMKRRLQAAGLPGQFSPHSLRVATVTDLLEQIVALEDMQHLAAYDSALQRQRNCWHTRLYGVRTASPALLPRLQKSGPGRAARGR